MTKQQKPRVATTQISVSRKRGVPESAFENFAGGLPGVQKCVQVFPGDTDPKLVCMYVVDADSDKADEVLKALQESPLTKYAERCPVRKLSPQR